jgi:hypothetical protein
MLTIYSRIRDIEGGDPFVPAALFPAGIMGETSSVDGVPMRDRSMRRMTGRSEEAKGLPFLTPLVIAIGLILAWAGLSAI